MCVRLRERCRLIGIPIRRPMAARHFIWMSHAVAPISLPFHGTLLRAYVYIHIYISGNWYISGIHKHRGWYIRVALLGAPFRLGRRVFQRVVIQEQPRRSRRPIAPAEVIDNPQRRTPQRSRRTTWSAPVDNARDSYQYYNTCIYIRIFLSFYRIRPCSL